MKRIIYCILIVSVILSYIMNYAYAASSPSKGGEKKKNSEKSKVQKQMNIHEIGPEAVWDPFIDLKKQLEKIHDLERKREEKIRDAYIKCEYDMECTVKKTGYVNQESLEFIKLLGRGMFMATFIEMGKVDKAEICGIVTNSPDVCSYVLVNGEPKVYFVSTDDIDIKEDSNYEMLHNRFPNLFFWGNGTYKSMELSPEKGQQFIFEFMLLDGCHACEFAGNARVSFNFDKDGRFVGKRLLGLKPPEETN